MIRLVGMGPGSMRHVTKEAVDCIKAADKVVAFGRIAQTAREIRPDIHVVKKVEEAAAILDRKQDIAFLASGDPCFYGILDFLQKKGIIVDEVIPGLSSMQYMMARLKKSWHDAALISFHGREAAVESIKTAKTAVILADSSYTPGYISRYLRDIGIKGKIFAGFNLSYEDELITEKRIGEPIEAISSLALVVIENEMD